VPPYPSEPISPIAVDAVTLAEQLLRAAAAVPDDHPAVIDRQRIVTYREYRRALLQLAGRIQAQIGTASARRLISYLPHGAESLIAQAAVLVSGHTLLPQVVEQGSLVRRAVLAQADPALVITSRAMQPLPAEYADGSLPVLWIDDPDVPAVPPTAAADAGQDALIYFTSGSTGRPRGVRLTHRTALGLIRLSAAEFAVTPSSRVLHAHADVAVAALMSAIGPLCCGATVVSAPTQDTTMQQVYRQMVRCAVTHATLLVPLMRVLGEAARQYGAVPTLRWAVTGGETVAPSDLALMRVLLAPDGTAVIGLGSTEIKAYTRWYLPPGEPIPTQLRAGGRLRPGFAALIVDEAGQLLPPETAGEMVIVTELMAAGYLADDAATAQRFIPAPDGSGRRAFRTGDYGRLCADGWLEYLGRLDDMVKIRGHRVMLSAVDHALSQVSLLREGVAVALEIAGERHLVAYVVWQAGVTPDEAQVRAELAQYLPPAAVPTRYLTLDALPRGVTGKVDRPTLPPPAMVRPSTQAPYAAPTTAIERQLAAVWCEILTLDDVGIDDDFFLLGGDSLLLFRLLLRVERQFAVQPALQPGLPLTVRGLAAALMLPADDRPAVRRAAVPAVRRWPAVLDRLPYAVGHRLLALLVRAGWRRRSAHRWPAIAAAAGIAADTSWYLHRLAGSFPSWRAHALRDPVAAARWVRVIGLEFIAQRPRGCGVVLVTNHTMLADVLHAQIDRLIDADHGMIHGAFDADLDGDRRVSLTRQLVQAHQHLRDGGAVVIAGDGWQGRGTVPCELLGRQVLLRDGAAALALSADALLVPIFITMAEDGRIQLECTAPLARPVGPPDESATAMTAQFAHRLVSRLPQLLPTYSERYLRQLLRGR
jgi:acyl-coenzyme A synthetase/AMP-(fatty) acid ligase